MNLSPFRIDHNRNEAAVACSVKGKKVKGIMNNAVTGWRAFSNPRYFPEPYRRQKGWERIRNDNEPDNSMDGFQEIPTEEMEQLGLPEEWLKQK